MARLLFRIALTRSSSEVLALAPLLSARPVQRHRARHAKRPSIVVITTALGPKVAGCKFGPAGHVPMRPGGGRGRGGRGRGGRRGGRPHDAFARYAQKNRTKKVRRWQEVSRYRAMLHRDGFTASSRSEPAEADVEASEGDASADAAEAYGASAPDASIQRSVAAAAPMELRVKHTGKRKKKEGAAAAARRQWLKDQEAVEAERQAAREAVAARKAAREQSRLRRARETAKMQKRTKRGQPVLGNQIEALLGRIQAHS